MTKDEVIRELCRIASTVGCATDNIHATDCFCDERKPFRWIDDNFRFDSEVIEFIKIAVSEKISQQSALTKLLILGPIK
jgi:hypothetical protein